MKSISEQAEEVVTKTKFYQQKPGNCQIPDSSAALIKLEAVDSSTNVEDVTIDAANSMDQDSRREWSNKCEFLISALGFAVGLGNIWRFPYVAYKNGGGSFMVPYLSMLILVGLPIFFLEFVLGQYSGCGPTRLFGKIAPMFKGLGFAMITLCFIIAIYYNVIIAWSIYYLFSGFNSVLPWSFCDPDLSSEKCTSGSTGNNMLNNITDGHDQQSWTPEEDFFNTRMLEHYCVTIGGFDPQDPEKWTRFDSWSWELVLCLFAAWTLVCFALIKGVRSSGKVMYFTVLFPYAMLIVLFGVGMSLDGAIDGITYYIKPNMTRLADPQVWSAATTQIFYSMGVTNGCIIMLASYNKKNHNCHRDALMVGFLNSVTSIFAGFVVFGILGFMAKQQKTTVDKVVVDGAALAFIAYPDAVGKMPFYPPLFSFLFFAMLTNLGLSTMISFSQNLTTALLDHFKFLRKYEAWVVIACCTIGFLCGLIFCTVEGSRLVDLVDAGVSSWNCILIAVLEVILAGQIYGIDQLFQDIQDMGMKIPPFMKCYWKLCWQFITPGILCIILSKLNLPYSIGLVIIGLVLLILEQMENKSENNFLVTKVQKFFKVLGAIMIGISVLLAVAESLMEITDINDAADPKRVQVAGKMLTLSIILVIPLMGAWNIGQRDPNVWKPTEKWRQSPLMVVDHHNFEEDTNDQGIVM